MNKGENSDPLPIDLILDILSRLPAKSTDRFRCVSKLWESMLRKPYFTELFFTRSSARRPRLLIRIYQDGEHFLFSSSQPQNPYEKSSSVVYADYQMKFGRDTCYDCKYVHYILTLGTENMRWRKIQTPLISHHLRGEEICISGVLYYLAYDNDDRIYVIGCFDVRSEEFKFLNLHPNLPYQASTRLVNCKGKLGVINLNDDGRFCLRLFLTVLEDVEKQQWSTYAYTLRDDNIVVKGGSYVSVVGMTALGEIVLATTTACQPFYVFYFDPERNTHLRVEIHGVGEDYRWFHSHTVCAFVDHVEDLQFNIMKATSINPTEQKHRPRSTSTSFREDLQLRTVAQRGQDRRTFESNNNFDALSLLEDD
ncbi:PREDICTED: F-box protein At1g31080-like [Camelina sativa]|uniref:F-box protein At1g31080-like n=1 Tax=Camelina sativa TaxID=90675 RepID=A0ABM0WZU9_CAMSA|nr:PREDICTED: F-box protein At1g31080-like [Camelina sativa]